MIDTIRQLVENLRDSYWRAEHQQELTIAAAVLVALLEIPFAWAKARAYRAGLA